MVVMMIGDDIGDVASVFTRIVSHDGSQHIA